MGEGDGSRATERPSHEATEGGEGKAMRRTMYSGSSGLLGSERMPVRLSSLTRCWSMTHSKALRLPRRWSNTSGGMAAKVSESLTTSDFLSLPSGRRRSSEARRAATQDGTVF